MAAQRHRLNQCKCVSTLQNRKETKAVKAAAGGGSGGGKTIHMFQKRLEGGLQGMYVGIREP